MIALLLSNPMYLYVLVVIVLVAFMIAKAVGGMVK